MKTLTDVMDSIRDRIAEEAKVKDGGPGLLLIYAIWPDRTMTFVQAHDEKVATASEAAAQAGATTIVKELRKALVVS